MPETNDTNVYDIRVVRHEDGWIYGLFCTERKDPKAPQWDTSAAVAQCGIARTKDLVKWERLWDLRTKSPQQRNVVWHPEFVDGKYALDTRPQDEFIQAGKGGAIGWGLCTTMVSANVEDEIIIDNREYHTIKEEQWLGSGTDQDGAGLAAPGSRCAEHGSWAALCVIQIFE
jgi:4-O-beta-D-mannosyl-D-glucose phosphorylase